MTGPCPECTDKIRRWEATSPSSTIGYSFAGDGYVTNSIGYDGTIAGCRDQRESRWKQWRDLVNFQTGLIRDICRKQHQPTGRQA